MAADPQDPLHQPRQALAAWERDLRPARESRRLLWVVLAVLLVFGAWRASEWLLTQRRATPPSGPFPTVRLPAVPTPVAQHTSAKADTPAALAAESYGVNKCLSATGQAEYSDRPCPTGTQASTVWVQSDVNLADGMSPAERAASRLNNQAAVAAQLQQAERQVVVQGTGSTRGNCAALEARIRWIDAAARQPQSAWQQDRLANERKLVRDEQFRARCQ
ncbi:MAG: hypothetical protein EOP81_08410 [Variovorax sp.]|nr:MAG: hypothetical protein EOP81_08410 [Variovorax sp.]